MTNTYSAFGIPASLGRVIRPSKYIRNMARRAGSAVKPFARRLAANITAPDHQRAAARAFLAGKYHRSGRWYIRYRA